MAVQMRQTEKDLSSLMLPNKGNSKMAASVDLFAKNKPTEPHVSIPLFRSGEALVQLRIGSLQNEEVRDRLHNN